MDGAPRLHPDTITDAWMDEFFPDYFNDEFQLHGSWHDRQACSVSTSAAHFFYSSPRPQSGGRPGVDALHRAGVMQVAGSSSVAG
jgi:hypothetical protein